MGTVKNIIITVAFSFMLASFVPVQAQGEVIEDKVIDLEIKQSHAKGERDEAKGERGHFNERLSALELKVAELEDDYGSWKVDEKAKLDKIVEGKPVRFLEVDDERRI